MKQSCRGSLSALSAWPSVNNATSNSSRIRSFLGSSGHAWHTRCRCLSDRDRPHPRGVGVAPPPACHPRDSLSIQTGTTSNPEERRQRGIRTMRRDSRLSPEEMERVKEWLASRGLRRCEACNSPTATWSQGAEIVYFPDMIKHDTHGYAAILLVCNNCGNMRAHSADLIGLMKSDTDESAVS